MKIFHLFCAWSAISIEPISRIFQPNSAMIKRLAAVLPAIVLFVLTLGAQPASSSFAPTEKALLWEIKGNQLPQPSYLFGTIHMISKRDFELREPVKTALSQTERVVFEIDMEKMSDISTLLPVMMKMYMRNDTTLSDLLSQDDYALVKAHFDKLGLPLAFLGRIKPMFLSMIASEDFMAMKDGPDSLQMVSYEMELLNLAKAGQKDVDGLETADFQMSIFDAIPYQAQAQMLVESIKMGGGEGGEFDEMVRMYKNQDIQAMQQMMESEDGIAQYEDVLLVGRNKNWIPVMSRLMSEGPSFFAVGAGHLGGPQGVIALLRQAGYEVTAVGSGGEGE